jgi:hypothetical protein
MTSANIDEKHVTSCTSLVLHVSVLALTLFAGLILLSVQSRAQSPLYQYQLLTTFPYQNGIYSFGSLPEGDVVEIKPGIFVGTTSSGGPQPVVPCPVGSPGGGCGSIFQLDTTTTPATLTLLWAFTGVPLCGGCLRDGAVPMGTIAWDGTFIYGTTTFGNDGCANLGVCGTVYRFDPSTLAMTTIYEMDASTSPLRNPVAGVFYANGHLYGTTNNGSGGSANGTVFEYTSPKSVAAGAPPDHVATLDPGTYGSLPQTLNEYSDGNLYGIPFNAPGEVFQYNTATHTVAPCFATASSLHVGRIGFGSDGAMYVANEVYPPVVFQFVPSNPPCSTPLSTTSLSSSAGPPGGAPGAGLLATSTGQLLGTLTGNDAGSNYSLSPSSVSPFGFYPIVNGNQGSRAELTEGSDGWIYGTDFQDFFQSPTGGDVYRFYLPPTQNVNQIGTLNIYDAGGPVAVDARPLVVPATDHQTPGPRIYIAGESDSNLPSIYGGQGSGGFFVARYLQDGTLDHTFGATSIGGSDGGFIQFGPGSVSRSNPDFVSAIAIDNSGNVLLAGSTTGGLYNCTHNQGGADIWVASFAPTGAFQWCKMFGSTQNDYVSDLTLDSSGNLYVTGSTNGSLPNQMLHGTTDAYIAKIAASGSHAVTISEFAENGQNVSTGGGIAYCAGNLYLSLDAGSDATVTDQRGWISEYSSSNFQTIASLELNPNYTTGPVATDLNCNVYLGAQFFTVSGGISQQYVALQQYDNLLTKKQWETDGPQRTAEGSQILYPDSITSLAIDSIGDIHAAGSTNGSMFNRPVPATCDLATPLITCAGWFATFAPNGLLYARSPQEFGNVQTGLGQIAVDLYGKNHVAGVTVGAVANGGETDNSIDAFEMDFGPTSFCPTFPVSCAPRKIISLNLSAPTHNILHGTNVTFTVQIKQGPNVVTSGSVTLVSDGFLPGAYSIVVSGLTPDANGTVTYSTSKLPKGVHNVTAVYSGTPTFNTQTSKIWPITVH